MVRILNAAELGTIGRSPGEWLIGISNSAMALGLPVPGTESFNLGSLSMSGK